MAIGDLLWACPYCGTVAGIRKGKGKGLSRCGSCSAEFRRGRGSTLDGRRNGSAWESKHPSVWVDTLPSVEEALASEDGDAEALRHDLVVATFAGPDEVIRRGSEVLGFRETTGRKLSGELTLFRDRLRFEAPEREVHEWALACITAIQSSSRVVQIKPRTRSVVTFRYRTGSPRLWEELLQYAVRMVYRERGWGEVREFQPRIVVR